MLLDWLRHHQIVYRVTPYAFLTQIVMLKELAYKNRSYRRFYQSVAISKEILLDLVDLARVSASGRNLQSLKYFISNEKSLNDKIFPTLAWAGYLKDWNGPVEGERPSGYIVMMEDTTISTSMVHDQGIAAQSILLGAVEKEFGGCIIASVKKAELSAALGLAAHLNIVLVIALGKPKEEVTMVEMKVGDDVKYWRDEQGHHYVPKRTLTDIVINL